MEERLKILVVEDDPVYADFVAKPLRAAGHDVDVANDAATARVLAKVTKHDAVFLDLGLPDESGYELARALRGALPSTAIIIVLTADRYPQRDVADAVGVDLVLSKPVEPAVVKGMIDVVRHQRQRRLATAER